MGILELKGVSKGYGSPVLKRLDLTVEEGEFLAVLGFSGTGSLKRSDWGLTWNVALDAGGLVLSDRIDLELDLSAIKAD